MEKKEWKKLIDLDKIIQGQKSKILKRIPQFVINWLKRLIYQKELNDLLYKLRETKGKFFVRRLRTEILDVKINIEGEENLSDSGKFIFVSNHPLGGVDTMCVLDMLSHKYDIRTLTNNLLMSIVNLRPLLLPVSVFGKTSNKEMDAVNETYESNIQILTFPAGFVARIIDGKVLDKEWHPSFVKNALRYQRDIVPIFVDEINSKLFYRIFKIRKFFRIKANLELFLLPHEMFNKKGHTIKIKVGKPIPYQTFTDKYDNYEWAQKVKMHVHGLATDINRNLQ